MPATTQTRTIKIRVDTKGSQELKEIASAMGGLNRNTNSLARNFSLIRNVFAGFIGGLGIQQIVEFSDTMQNLNNRLAVLTGSQEGANKAMKQLLATANETNTSVDSLAEIYARLGNSLSNTGASTESLLALTKVLQNSFRLSGATTAETTSTIIQLSQAFASGQVRGQELRSVLEQNAVVAIALRKEFGKDIFKKAEQGMISAADVLNVLIKNFDDINKKAEVLAPTIGQTLTKALNSLKSSINDVNKEFGISSGFADAVDAILPKLGLIAAAIGFLALTRLPQLVSGINALALAMFRFSTSNPLTAALLAVSVAIVATNKDMDDFTGKVKRATAATLDFYAAILKIQFDLKKGIFDKIGFLDNGSFAQDIQDLGNDILGLRNKAKELRASPLLPKDALEGADNGKKNLEALRDKMTDLASGGKIPKVKELLGELNKEFLRGSIGAREYNAKLVDFNLYKLNREFSEGKFNLTEYNERLKEIKITRLNADFVRGTTALADFRAEVAQVELDNLKYKLDAGAISLQEFDSQLVKVQESFSANSAFRAGATDYITSIGTVSSQVADAIKNTFIGLETSLTEFIKTGQFNFAKFTQSILDDLLKIIIRAQIIRPLAEGLLNYGSTATAGTAVGGGGGQYASPNVAGAHGLAFDKGLKKFASGGVVTSPTVFGYGKGKSGLMGEAGPEAILPLSRGSGGDLGVQATVTPVTINVINQAGADVQTSEKSGPNGEKMIELLITAKVREGLGSGSYDKVMQQSYGIRRKGS